MRKASRSENAEKLTGKTTVQIDDLILLRNDSPQNRYRVLEIDVDGRQVLVSPYIPRSKKEMPKTWVPFREILMIVKRGGITYYYQ